MLKMWIELDEEKILAEKKYDLASIHRVIKDSCASRGIYADKEGFYVGGTFGKFGGLILGLSKEEWFMDNVKQWLWYNSDESDDPNSFVVEDIKKHFWVP